MTQPTTDSAYSQQDPDDGAHDFSARQFQINQTLARVRTMVLVKVTAIQAGAGAVAMPGTVTVQPLVKLIDGQGNASSHGTINNVPVFRLGGGKNAVICDPIVGDIGWLAVADRDISAVKSSKAEATPGSRRKFDMADGVYMGSLLSPVPEQYITFTSTGLEIGDKNGNKLTSDDKGWHFNKPVFIDGQLNLSGAVKALDGSATYANAILTTAGVEAGVGGADHVTMQAHQHPGNNLPPTPGH